jgi:hypothetical protein
MPLSSSLFCLFKCLPLYLQVLQLPPGATLLATSPTAVNELWCWGPNILASQFHVEFDEPLVLEKIWASLKDIGRLDAQQAERSRQVLEAGGQMNANMLQVGLVFETSVASERGLLLRRCYMPLLWFYVIKLVRRAAGA